MNHYQNRQSSRWQKFWWNLKERERRKMGRKIRIQNWVIEQGMECQSISLEEKYLIEKYNELEEKEDQVYAWLLSQNDELIQKAALKLKQIDQVQDQIIIRLLECEDKQISGHVHLNQKLGRIKNVESFEDDLLPIA